MKVIIILLGLILIGGPLYVLYHLGLKYFKHKKRRIESKKDKKIENIIKTDTYKIRYGSQDKK